LLLKIADTNDIFIYLRGKGGAVIVVARMTGGVALGTSRAAGVTEPSGNKRPISAGGSMLHGTCDSPTLTVRRVGEAGGGGDV